jgi:hypothetical protein
MLEAQAVLRRWSRDCRNTSIIPGSSDSSILFCAWGIRGEMSAIPGSGV